MSRRAIEASIYVFAIVAIAGCLLYFRYHQFHWWLLIIPAIGVPLKIIAYRVQQASGIDKRLRTPPG
jgi:hypothetical protein